MIDLRSDTLTKPTAGMRRAMADAQVGDDVFGEDATTNALQERVAAMLDKEAALFVPSGSMGNQIGVRLHCGPGDEFLCESQCHIFHYEQATYAQLFGISAQTVDAPDGLLAPSLLKDRIRGGNVHQPITRLLTLENTHNRHGGRVLSYDGVAQVCGWAQEQGLARHLDGARLWNAVVGSEQSAAEWAALFDTVSVCFSKGLGAPIGSMLCGTKEQMTRAHRLRKAMGGGMRQTGVLAAAANYALDHHLDRLHVDHAAAQILAEAVKAAPQLTLVNGRCDTNLVIFEVDPEHSTAAEFVERLREQGVLMLAITKTRVRAVTHMDVTLEDVKLAASLLQA